MSKLKLLKIIVFFMTFIFIFGLLCATTLIYKKVSAPKTARTDISLNQPKGSYIADYKIDNPNLYILIKGGNQADRIVTVNIKDQTLGSSIKTY